MRFLVVLSSAIAALVLAWFVRCVEDAFREVEERFA